jgi:ADP-ribosylglycohydrolase
MERVARLIEPSRAGPWHEMAGGDAQEPGAEALMAPVVLWALGRRGVDPPFFLAAAASVARLTHTSPVSIADACLFALALQELAIAGRIAAVEARLEGWCALAERWGGAAPSQGVLDVVHDAARRLSSTEVGSGPSALVACLVGLATGLPVATDENAELVAALRALDDPR